MNKMIFVATMIFAVPAFAKTVPVPPKRPAELTAPAPIFNTDPNMYGAVVKDGQVIIRAPLGSDTQVDVDGNSFQVDVNNGHGVFDRILPWNWKW